MKVKRFRNRKKTKDASGLCQPYNWTAFSKTKEIRVTEPSSPIRIVFPRTGEVCEVDYDDTLVDATFRYDLPIRYRCERAVCATCLVEVLQGMGNLSSMEEREAQTLKAIGAKPNWRLSCQVSVLGPVELDYVPITDPRRQAARDDNPIV
jgi:ferredoxin